MLNDVMFNMDRKRDPLGFLFTTLLGSAPGPRVSRLAKLLFIKDKQATRADFERFAELPGLTRVIVAHEKVASGGYAKAALLWPAISEAALPPSQRGGAAREQELVAGGIANDQRWGLRAFHSSR